MNLVASLSIDGERAIGTMDWYDMLEPLISLQMPHFPIKRDVLCKELLAAILDLPGETRAKILMVRVPSKEEEIEAVQEAKQQSHRGMLVGIGGIVTVLALIILGMYVTIVTINGGTVDKEAVSTIGTIVKELIQVFVGSQAQ